MYQAIAESLRSAIQAGEYAAGDTIPAEAELAARFDVSRDTVRRALNRLTAEGLLTEGRGRLGRQVREVKRLIVYAVRSESLKRLAERAPLGTDAWVTDATEQKFQAGQTISVAIEEPGPDIVRRLALAEGERVVVRRRVRTLDGVPHNLNDTYYPASIAEGTPIMYPADVPQGTIALMRELGYVQIDYEDEVSARMPTPDEMRLLGMPHSGVPVMIHYRTGFTAARPVKLTITVWPADRTLLVWEFDA